MREVGRALALDPGNATALAAMMRLLTTSPRVLPPEVRAEMKLSQHMQNKATGRLGAFSYATIFLYLPLFFWLGVRDVIPLVLLFAGGALTTLVSIWVARHPGRPRGACSPPWC